MTEGSRPSPKSAMKASTEGSTERKGALKGAPKEREHRSEGGGDWKKRKKEKSTFGPRSKHVYFKSESGHSVFYIYRFVQELKWLCSVTCK